MLELFKFFNFVQTYHWVYCISHNKKRDLQDLVYALYCFCPFSNFDKDLKYAKKLKLTIMQKLHKNKSTYKFQKNLSRYL